MDVTPFALTGCLLKCSRVIKSAILHDFSIEFYIVHIIVLLPIFLKSISTQIMKTILDWAKKTTKIVWFCVSVHKYGYHNSKLVKKRWFVMSDLCFLVHFVHGAFVHVFISCIYFCGKKTHLRYGWVETCLKAHWMLMSINMLIQFIAYIYLFGVCVFVTWNTNSNLGANRDSTMINQLIV